MRRLSCIPVAAALVLLAAPGAPAQSDQAKVLSATSAAPASISAAATVLDWPAEPGAAMRTLREGTNGWTCLPDMPQTSGTDPMCLDAAWMGWADAWMNRTTPTTSVMGFGYMLQGGSPGSNTDPYAEGPTAGNEWIEEEPPHVMMLVPDAAMLDGLPTSPTGGGPWVMWRGTPYVHVMVPMPRHRPGMPQ